MDELDPIPGSVEEEPTAEQKVEQWKYQTDTCIVLPYSETNTHAFSEDFLLRIYALAKQQDLLFMFDSSGTLTLNRFIKYFADKPFLVSFRKPDYNVAGIGWINECEGWDGCRKASMGFGFFRESWGKQVVRDSARLALTWWFNELKIDVLFGVQETSNRLASRFSKQMGFTEVAVLPKWLPSNRGLLDARLVTLTRESFNASGGGLWVAHRSESPMHSTN